MAKDVDQMIATAGVVTEVLSWSTSMMALYVTAVSGYLLVAYLLGRRLSRLQVSTFTGLFVFFASFMTLGTYSAMTTAHEMGRTYGFGDVPQYPGVTAAVIMAMGIVASLKFMWDVRHPKTE